MRNVLIMCGFLVILTGCTAEFWRDFKQNQAAWNDYVNSDAYYQTTTTSTLRTDSGTTYCSMTCDRRDGSCATRCSTY